MEYLVTFVTQKPFVSQPELFVTTSDLDHPALHALDDTEAVLGWTKFEPILSTIYASKTGRPSYPLLTLFRGLLLGVWYQLSDVQLSQCLYRDLLFRKFCHLELGGDVPEASTLGRFRNHLVEHDLWECLLGEANRQLEAKNIILTEGKISLMQHRLRPRNPGQARVKTAKQSATKKQAGMSKKTVVAI